MRHEVESHSDEGMATFRGMSQGIPAQRVGARHSVECRWESPRGMGCATLRGMSRSTPARGAGEDSGWTTYRDMSLHLDHGFPISPKTIGFWYNFNVFRGGESLSRGARDNAARQSPVGMSEVSTVAVLMQRQAHTPARLSSYSTKGFSDSLYRDRREAVSFRFGCRLRVATVCSQEVKT